MWLEVMTASTSASADKKAHLAELFFCTYAQHVRICTDAPQTVGRCWLLNINAATRALGEGDGIIFQECIMRDNNEGNVFGNDVDCVGKTIIAFFVPPKYVFILS